MNLFFHQEKKVKEVAKRMSEIISNGHLRYLWDKNELLGRMKVTMKWNWTAWQQLSGNNMVSWLEAGSGDSRIIRNGP